MSLFKLPAAWLAAAALALVAFPVSALADGEADFVNTGATAYPTPAMSMFGWSQVIPPGYYWTKHTRPWDFVSSIYRGGGPYFEICSVFTSYVYANYYLAKPCAEAPDETYVMDLDGGAAYRKAGVWSGSGVTHTIPSVALDFGLDSNTGSPGDLAMRTTASDARAMNVLALSRWIPRSVAEILVSNRAQHSSLVRTAAGSETCLTSFGAATAEGYCSSTAKVTRRGAAGTLTEGESTSVVALAPDGARVARLRLGGRTRSAHVSEGIATFSGVRTRTIPRVTFSR